MTDPYAAARTALSDPNTPQNLREILEAELGRSEEVDYEFLIGCLQAQSTEIARRGLNGWGNTMQDAATAIETLLRRCERLDQLWTEALGCAAMSMERVRELEGG